MVKGTRFSDFVDVGDPVSQAMIYDAQGADELLIVDVEASKTGKMIDTKIISQMIEKCRLPIGAGGGIKTVEDARRCLEAGADKIIINTHAALNFSLVKELACEFGSQSVVGSLDVRKDANGDYEVYIYSGTRRVIEKLESIIKKLTNYGVGELIVTSIDKEGTLSGFDYDLYKRISSLIPVPLIASGGAGSYDDIARLFKETDCDACAIGKMLFLRDYDIIRIKSYLRGEKVGVREA